MPKEHLSSEQVVKFWAWVDENINNGTVRTEFRDLADNSGWVIGNKKEPMFMVGGRLRGSEADLYYPTTSAEELAKAGVIFDREADRLSLLSEGVRVTYPGDQV